MNCKATRGLFSLHIDRGLSYADQGEVDHHLEACPDCALEYRRLKRTVEMVRDLPEVSPTPSFVQDVLCAARVASGSPVAEPAPTFWEMLRESISSIGWEPSSRLAIAGAALLVLGIGVGIGGGVLIFRDHSVGEPIGRPIVQVMPAAPAVSDPSTAAVAATRAASGPFEDLVQQMMRRLETNTASVTDTASVPALDWRSSRIPGPVGQPVDANPLGRRYRQGGGRVYIDF